VTEETRTGRGNSLSDNGRETFFCTFHWSFRFLPPSPLLRTSSSLACYRSDRIVRVSLYFTETWDSLNLRQEIQLNRRRKQVVNEKRRRWGQQKWEVSPKIPSSSWVLRNLKVWSWLPEGLVTFTDTTEKEGENTVKSWQNSLWMSYFVNWSNNVCWSFFFIWRKKEREALKSRDRK
jgi:hypothetical protein